MALDCRSSGSRLSPTCSRRYSPQSKGSQLIPGERDGRRLWSITCPTAPPESARSKGKCHVSHCDFSIRGWVRP